MAGTKAWKGGHAWQGKGTSPIWVDGRAQGGSVVAAVGSQCNHEQLAVVGLGLYSGGHGELLRLYEQQVT